jgi:hypothetical protein
MNALPSLLKTTAKRSMQAVRAQILELNRRAGRFDEVLWLVGEGRSGTTWIARLLNGDGRYRQLFEPVHPHFVEEFSFVGWRPYRRPDEDDARLEAALGRVFSGALSSWWIDRDNYRLFYRGMVVKDVHATLLIPWALRRFRQVKPILLVRNPFAVARSRMAQPKWWWPETPAADLLRQPQLMADHLGPYADLLAKVVEGGDYIVNQVAAWAATHHVLFRMMDPRDVHVLLYEQALADPAGEIARLDAFIGRDTSRTAVKAAEIARPSRVSMAASVAATRSDPAGAWRRGLGADDIDGGLRILDAFGFGDLYDDRGQPVRLAFERAFRRREGMTEEE